ncbi:uncharacterized protein LOC107882695 [Acyrthosiphon pisum]|uniref:Uncharacterized protein n=1 Tax=Acyrthosiphon pisum TaxID=7029 RepID=A0A8R2H3N7_ACYPI|nr:uncharacterized protein LOC107882695 [Acyrthosiphon pisum]|eukprot:XP_016656916.1 PREDICTED: uncharacterized protein LOC107882695 [Acyrthosiphon pisum]
MVIYLHSRKVKFMNHSLSLYGRQLVYYNYELSDHTRLLPVFVNQFVYEDNGRKIVYFGRKLVCIGTSIPENNVYTYLHISIDFLFPEILDNISISVLQTRLYPVTQLQIQSITVSSNVQYIELYNISEALCVTTMNVPKFRDLRLDRVNMYRK